MPLHTPWIRNKKRGLRCGLPYARHHTSPDLLRKPLPAPAPLNILPSPPLRFTALFKNSSVLPRRWEEIIATGQPGERRSNGGGGARASGQTLAACILPRPALRHSRVEYLNIFSGRSTFHRIGIRRPLHIADPSSLEGVRDLAIGKLPRQQTAETCRHHHKVLAPRPTTLAQSRDEQRRAPPAARSSCDAMLVRKDRRRVHDARRKDSNARWIRPSGGYLRDVHSRRSPTA